MSAFFNRLVKTCLLFNNRIPAPCQYFHSTAVKHLYAPAAIGIDNYILTRKKINEQFTNFSDNFRAKMRDFVSQPKNMIFTEDLKNMVHLAEASDLDLIISMIKKFNTQNSEFRFGSFIFGPVVMRMFHYLHAPDQALECFNDPANNGFFDQQVSFQILLDLLYENQRYNDMYQVFEVLKEKQINMTKYPKYPVVLVLAACYKQNTAQSFELACKLWTDMVAVGSAPLRRASAYLAALALNQGAPHTALESISMQRQHYVTMRNIKARALAELSRAEDALLTLRHTLDSDTPDDSTQKHTFFEETIQAVKRAVENSGNKDTIKEFENVEKALRERGLVDNKTLDQMVSSEITITKKQDPKGMPSNYNTKRMPFGLRHKNA